MDFIADIIAKTDSLVWGPPLLILLVGVHVFLTVKLKFIQRYIPLGIKLSLAKDDDASGEISQFGALAIALAATIGTGNIIGVATAIVLGGPGAVFWCWLCGVFGIATKYSESLLAIKYRTTDSSGKIHGGPMYAIERGMNKKFLAVIFALFTVAASFGIGNLAQSNAVASFSHEAFGIAPWISGVAETVLIGLVVLGGIKSISKVCSALVPFMAVFYIAGCFIILSLCFKTVPAAISLIVTEAFNFKSAAGGVVGGGIMLSMRYGIARGLFSNESGMGSAPIIAANAQTRNPVRQALISSTGTFWDTVCVCAITGITQIAAILKLNPNADFSKYQPEELAKIAFSNIPHCGLILLSIALTIFACTTILGWFCYGEEAIHYLGGKKAIFLFRVIFVIMIYFGAVAKLEAVWNFSDIANGLMAIPNIICLFALYKVIVSETDKYLKNGSIDDYEVPEKN